MWSIMVAKPTSQKLFGVRHNFSEREGVLRPAPRQPAPGARPGLLSAQLTTPSHRVLLLLSPTRPSTSCSGSFYRPLLPSESEQMYCSEPPLSTSCCFNQGATLPGISSQARCFWRAGARWWSFPPLCPPMPKPESTCGSSSSCTVCSRVRALRPTGYLGDHGNQMWYINTVITRGLCNHFKWVTSL